MTRGAISFGVAFLVSFLLTPFVLGGVALTILDRGCVSIGKPVIFQAASAPARDSASPPAARPTRAEGAPVRLMIFGPTLGFLEPCGCTGGQTGGLSRRKTLLDAATTQDPTLVVLDAGELLRGAGPLERIRGETAASVYRDMKVGAVAVGKNDLAAGETELRAQIHGHPSVLTAKGAGEPILRASIVSRVLVLALHETPGTSMEDEARVELTKNAGKFDAAVAFVYAARQRTRELAEATPDLDVVVVARGAGSPDSAPEKVGSSVLFHAGERGRDLVRLEGARRGGKFVADRYAIEAVVATIPADPSSEEEIAKYRERLRDDGVVKKAVGALPAPGKGYAPPDTGLDLVGSEVCSKCHEGAFKVWKESKHSHGIASLVDQKKLGEFDPECLKCHAVGWFNDEGKGEVGGYDADPKGRLAGVGCESCHGPAGAHVEAPKLVKPARDVDCRKCHDDDNSPHFDRATYWPKIAHKKF